MFEFFFKVWFLIAILPFLIFQQGVVWFKGYLKKHNREWDSIYYIYALLIVLVIILLVLLAFGYPW
jgi:heme/copper-type cytochrome/quinol oxidase subunit 2